MAKSLFKAQEIRDRIVPSAPVAIAFAERLYTTPEERPSREILLRAILEKLPRDQDLKPVDRFQVEARTWFLLNDRERARAAMEKAHALDPKLATGRVRLVDWLIGWGRAREANDQALIGLYYAPGDAALQQARDRAAEAIAKTEH
jgi:hypothetical protein